MAFSITHSSATRIVLISLMALALSACASSRPVPRTAQGAYFTAPVFQGDTLASFSQRYGVQPNDVLALNRVRQRKSTGRLINGRLRVPTYVQARSQRLAPAVQTVRPIQPAVQRPEMMTPEVARVPTPRRPASIEARSLAPVPVTSTRNSGTRANGLDTPDAAPATVPAVLPQRSSQAEPAPAQDETSWYDWFVTVTPSVGSGDTAHRFIWPVEGRVISPFGENSNGGRNDGINISIARGTPVRAADSGEVTYVGNELKGYGNLILIRHDNGFVTAYAHADDVHVKRGERVERGQVIGTVGDTGNVSRPQLHFELRQGTRPIDPAPHLVAAPRQPSDGSGNRLAEGPR